MSNQNVNLSPEMIDRLKKLQREGQTFNEVLEQVCKLGCYSLEYRREQNPKKAIRQKEDRLIARAVRLNPELAKQCGIAVKDDQAVKPVNIHRS